MKKTGVLAFCGSKGSGKSTAYSMFKNIFHNEIEELALAGHLKKVCSTVFGVDMKYFLEPELKETELEEYKVLQSQHIEKILNLFEVDESKYSYNAHIRPHIGQVFETPRSILQYVGTEVLHPIDPLIHAKMVLDKKDPNKLTVVTDLRFKNEFEFFNKELKYNFTPIYIKNSKAELAASIDPHPSETQLHTFKEKCYRLPNESSKSELRRRLYLLSHELFGGEENATVRKS